MFQDKSGQPLSKNGIPLTSQTKQEPRDQTAGDRPSSSKIYEVDPTLASSKAKSSFTSPNVSEANTSCNDASTGDTDKFQAYLLNKLDHLAAGEGLGEEALGQGRTDSNLLGRIVGVQQKQASKKHTEKTAGRLDEEESAKNSRPEPDCMANYAEASQLRVQISPHLSAEELCLEGNNAAQATFQETSKSRPNHSGMGTHSLRVSVSEVDLVVNSNTVEHSDSLESSNEDLAETDIDITTVKIKKSRRTNKGKRPSGDQKLEISDHSECQEGCDRVSDVHQKHLNTETGSRGQSIHFLASIKNEEINLDKQRTLGQAYESLEVGNKEPENEKKRPQGDEALYKLACQSYQHLVKSSTLDGKHLPVHSVADETAHERDSLIHVQIDCPPLNPANSPKFTRESSVSRASELAHATDTEMCNLKEWFDEELFIGSNPQEHVTPSKGVKIVEEQQDIASQSVGSLEQPEMQTRASSEESSCKPTMRRSSEQNTPEDLHPMPMALERALDWIDSQNQQGQNKDAASVESTRVQSEQGSYSPCEGNIRCTDLPSEDNANYLDDSDAFSLPESDDCSSSNLSSKEEIHRTEEPLSPELE